MMIANVSVAGPQTAGAHMAGAQTSCFGMKDLP